MTDLRLLFTTDLHGSDPAFRKFVNAAVKFKVRTLVIGGDLTGKTLVPVVRTGRGYRAEVLGKPVEVATETERAELERTLRHGGQYPFRCGPEELQFLNDHPEEVEARFADAMRASLQDWFDLAAERLGLGSGARLLVIAGNDDPWAIDSVLREHGAIEYVDGTTATLDDGTELIGLGGSNQTPWHSPREYSEDEIEARLRTLAEKLAEPHRSIWTTHVPPAGSGLDTAAQVTDDLRMVMVGGQPVPVPIGSASVRGLIGEFQPLAGLHGHVHESPGISLVGRTAVVNPGSEYTEGILRAALVTTRKGKPIIQLMSA
jgi:Icc-related predicted phosphoesterase